MIDAVPVWQAWNDTRFSAQELQGAETGLQLETSFIQEWGAANQHRLRGYKAAVVVLLPLLLLLAYRSRRGSTPQPEMQAAARVLRRPISAWLLLTLIGVVLVFPDAPLVMHQMAMLLALIPVLRLLPQKVFRVLGPWPYVGTALYLLYRLGFLLLGQPLFYRLYILAVSFVTACVVGWLLYSAARKRARAGVVRTNSILSVLAWIAVLALVVAMIANVVGNVSLAEMLASAVLDSAYLGLALYAGTNVLSRS